jgi:methionine-rich copper-binding protein CopC
VSFATRLVTLGRWRRLAAAAVVGVLAGGLAILGLGSPAAAHGQFVTSDPAPGTTVTTPIERILLYFTEKPTSNAFFSVTSPTGLRVDRLWTHGPTRTLDTPVYEWFHKSDGSWVTRKYTVAVSAQLPIAYWPETGEYTVDYLSVATDGEPVRGRFTFTYAGPVAPKPPDFRPQAPAPDPNLLAVVSDGPTGPPSALSIEEQIAIEQASGWWVLWVPLGIAVLVALTIYLFWKLRPQLVRDLMLSRFGGRYAAPTQRRPLQLPSVVAQRLPDIPARLQEKLPVRLQERLSASPQGGRAQSPRASADQQSTGPDQQSTGPEQRNTGPDQQSTGPEQRNTGPEQHSTVPEQHSTVPEQRSTGESE